MTTGQVDWVNGHFFLIKILLRSKYYLNSLWRCHLFSCDVYCNDCCIKKWRLI